MNAAKLALALVTLAAPVAGFFAILARLRPRLAAEDQDRERLRITIGTVAFGAIAFVPAWLLEERLQAWARLDDHARAADITSLVYTFLVAAPLEQGLKVAAITPVWRSRHFEAPIDGLVYAAAAALGFISAHNLEFFISEGATGIHAARALLAVPAHLFFAAAWGVALGRAARARARSGNRSARLRFGGRTFNLTWLGAMLFNGVFDHIVYTRGVVALVAAAPILLMMLIIGYVTARDYLKVAPPESAPTTIGPATRRQRILRTLAPPSLRAVRDALSRTEHPLMLRWIGFGALVQAGVITACLVGAVALGHRLGVDFAAVDQGDAAGAASLGPLVLLGGATLAAFPFAGYLVARASSTKSVLEPAIAAALAIIGALVLLGVAAPITVVFAVAFAPVAFGLACAGAWVGISR